MNEKYYSLSQLMSIARDTGNQWTGPCMEIDTDALQRLKPADVRPVNEGHWIPVTNGRGGHECDQCHDYAPSYQNGDERLSHFCPNCGAKMRGEPNG